MPAVYDGRLSPLMNLLLPDNERMSYPECNPKVPNLSVGDTFLESLTDFSSIMKKTSLFLIGLSNSSDPDTCYSEELLKSLYRDFKRGLWELEVISENL